jgi:hypothetical protein
MSAPAVKPPPVDQAALLAAILAELQKQTQLLRKISGGF